MSVTSKIPDVAILGLLVSLCLLSDRGFGTAETIVDTDPHVVLKVGTRGILPCRIQTKAYSVEWKRQLSSETELLVLLDTYVYVGARDGPGYEAGLFNITDDYSLVIKDVKVQDEGLYICSVSDFTSGKPFGNSTRVSVQAFPDEPFPTIPKCIGNFVKPGVCTLAINATSNLTCFVKGYYPDIDLFFLHGSEKVTSTQYKEWNNTDGTKNKNITIPISVSEELYECLASRLPGMVRNRSITVIVKAIPYGPRVAVTVVPVLVVGICLSIAVIFKCYLGNRRGYELSFMLVFEMIPIEGPVSKPELWKLVTKAKENNVVKKLRAVLRRLRKLSKTEASKLENDDEFYESLCEWKKETSSKSNQRKLLYFVCNKEGMSEIIRTLKDFVRNTNYEVSRANINHILWSIGDPKKIDDLLKALGLDHEAVVATNETERKDLIGMIGIARSELLKWREREFDMNPLVILSLKLDELECETDFFKLQLRQKEEIDVEEMKDICCKIFKLHFTSLLKVTPDNHGKLANQIKRFVEENNASLLNTVQMLKDWEQDEECSFYEKRNKLQKAEKAATKRGHTDAKWPPDDDLRIIASFLSPASMGPLCSELHIKTPPEEASQEERFQALTEWRDNHASSKDLEEKYDEFCTALNEVGGGGLIPRFRDRLVYKAELVDLAFNLFAQDLLPFTEALGISAAKLVTYRPTFKPSHMTMGTIGLVFRLFKSGQRSDSFSLLKEMPYPNVFASGMLALEISFGEVCAISVGPVNCKRKERWRRPLITLGDHNTFTRTIKINICSSNEVESISPGANSIDGDTPYTECILQQSQNEIYIEAMNDLHDLAIILKSADKVKDHDQVSHESLDFIKQFKLWRERPRRTPFNLLLAIANRLRSEDNQHLISDFLRGDYKKGKIPFSFIHNILENMDPEQRCILAKLMGDASFTPLQARLASSFSEEDGWSQLTDAVSRNMHAWVEEWIQQIIQAKWEKGEDGFIKITEIAEKHKEFNDKLVDQGFIDLAREIMICE